MVHVVKTKSNYYLLYLSRRAVNFTVFGRKILVCYGYAVWFDLLVPHVPSVRQGMTMWFPTRPVQGGALGKRKRS